MFQIVVLSLVSFKGTHDDCLFIRRIGPAFIFRLVKKINKTVELHITCKFAFSMSFWIVLPKFRKWFVDFTGVLVIAPF